MDAEIQAIGVVLATLAPFDKVARIRILKYADAWARDPETLPTPIDKAADSAGTDQPAPILNERQ